MHNLRRVVEIDREIDKKALRLYKTLKPEHQIPKDMKLLSHCYKLATNRVVNQIRR